MSNALGFVRFQAVLELETDLHIGDGGEVDQGGDVDRKMTTVVRDARGKPVIPGTTLKGVLRAAVTAGHGEGVANRLFGAIKTTANPSGHIGRITLYAAQQCREGDASDLPESGLPSTAMATHVAIGRKYGVALAGERMLFNREIVPTGARFRLEGVVARGVQGAVADLKTALAPLVVGVVMGRGGAKGNGRVRLVDAKVETMARRLDTSGPEPSIVESGWSALPLSSQSAGRMSKSVHFELRCPGSFLSHDPDRRVEGQSNVLFALRRSANRPVLWPESLYGVLRERCAWLAAIDRIGDGGKDDKQRFTPLPAGTCPSTLGRTGRLFGVPGWRGLVRIGAFDLSGGKSKRLRNGDEDSSGGMAGISIDRFSGAVLDTGPFFTDAWVDLTLKFALALESRGGFPLPEDHCLFDDLVKYIRAEGLLLGHGANRGHGWFEPVQRKEEVPS